MKYITLFIAMCALMQTSTYAQTAGIKGGLSVSNLSTNDSEIDGKNAKAGFTAGVFYNAPFGGFFAIQPEILYTQKGADYNVGSIEVENRSSYIELPLMVQFTLLDPFYIYAGPQASYLLDVNTTYKGGPFEVFEDEDPDDYNRLDFGGAVGFGLAFDRLTIDARAVLGVIDYDKERTLQGIEVEARNLKNLNAQLTLGLIISR